MKIRGLELDVHRLVVGVASGTAIIDVGILRIQACQSRVPRSILRGLTKKHIAAAQSVDVLDVVQVKTAGSGILQRKDRRWG